jgi:5'-phosphate synthase pdxT subunit
MPSHLRLFLKQLQQCPSGETGLTDQTPPRIGVLAIQGDYQAHANALAELGALPSLVKSSQGLSKLNGLVLPGGESTTMLKFLDHGGFFEDLQHFALETPVFGTCAGAILLAKRVRNPEQHSLGIVDMTVERNAYGAQRDSAILELDTTLPGGPLETVFIRAPRIVSVGPGVEVLAEREGFPVLIRQTNGNSGTMAATFHPELSRDRRVHKLFLDLVQAARQQS